MSRPIDRAIVVFEQFQYERKSSKPIYIQFMDWMVEKILDGSFLPGQSLPSSRQLAQSIRLNRLTFVKAFEELQLQGWIESHVGRGTSITEKLPIIQMQANQLHDIHEYRHEIKIPTHPYLVPPPVLPPNQWCLDDGFPDPKLVPFQEYYRAYRNQFQRGNLYQKFGMYGPPEGTEYFRSTLATYIQQTRNMLVSPENICSTHGTVMAINLVCNTLLSPGDTVLMGIPGWGRAEQNFRHAKANLIGITVDQNGILTDEIRTICKRQSIKMVYITPHHHYPTTVSLSMSRRMELIRLANEFGFFILEDDYDFDFHYARRPLMPLAASDPLDRVIYVSSFSKLMTPAFRCGFLIASADLIKQLAKVRSILDRQGDPIIENALAQLIAEGGLQRYLRKALTLYRHRRDYFCQLLDDHLLPYLQYKKPEGGMSVWLDFSKNIALDQLAEKALKRGLYISNGKAHQNANATHNGIRVGFASSEEQALQHAVKILQEILDSN